MVLRLLVSAKQIIPAYSFDWWGPHCIKNTAKPVPLSCAIVEQKQPKSLAIWAAFSPTPVLVLKAAGRQEKLTPGRILTEIFYLA